MRKKEKADVFGGSFSFFILWERETIHIICLIRRLQAKTTEEAPHDGPSCSCSNKNGKELKK